MLPQTDMQEEMLRYTAIAKEPSFGRPVDWFTPLEYVVVKIVDEYFAGKILEIKGKNPPILRICMFQGRNACDDVTENCRRGCPKRLLTLADNGAVLNEKDLLRLLEHPSGFGFPVLSYRNIEELYGKIEKLEKRQNTR